MEVKAFYLPCNLGEELKYVDRAMQWKVEMNLGFAYLVNGHWRASSWPSLWERTRIDQPWVDDYVQSGGKE